VIIPPRDCLIPNAEKINGIKFKFKERIKNGINGNKFKFKERIKNGKRRSKKIRRFKLIRG